MSLDAFESRLTSAAEAIASACLFGILVLISVLVLLRYVFNAGIVGANEIATVLFVYASAIGAAVEVGRREHIAITFAVERLSASLRQAAAVASFALVAVLNAVIAWQSVKWIAVTGGYVMPATQMPRYVVEAAIPLGCLLATLYCLLGINRLLHKRTSA